MDESVTAFAEKLRGHSSALGEMAGVEWRVSQIPVAYEPAVAAMEERAAAIFAGEAPELIWFLEHPALYTAGASAKRADLLDPARLPVHRTGRGGQYTYHGPGQLVAYVLLDLNRRGRDVRRHVHSLEAWVTAALAGYGIKGERRDGRPGIWVRSGSRDEKIAAIGVRVRRWVTYHGVAINICPDLSHFEGIVPCGIEDAGVTSLAKIGTGDTIHPSTLQVMDELGLYDRLLQRPHHKAHSLKGRFGDLETTFADFSHLPTRAKFVAFMPQWDFLDFLADEAKAYPAFKLFMKAEATDLIWDGEKIAGVTAKTADGVMKVHAPLVIGCDGRHAMTRKAGRFSVEDVGAPMDVLWFRLSRRDTDPEEPVGSFGRGHIVIMIDRGDYWQCGYVIPKGSFDRVREEGLPAFRQELETLAPFLKGRAEEVKSFDDIRLLTVGVDRLREWRRPGLLCIGDAAHTMSPVGGVGINLAIQDAIAAANILAEPLRAGRVTVQDLARVQSRRESPTRRTQWLQVQIQNNVIKNVLGKPERFNPPFLLRLMKWFPALARIPARVIGLGFRPEHPDPGLFHRR